MGPAPRVPELRLACGASWAWRGAPPEPLPASPGSEWLPASRRAQCAQRRVLFEAPCARDGAKRCCLSPLGALWVRAGAWDQPCRETRDPAVQRFNGQSCRLPPALTALARAGWPPQTPQAAAPARPALACPAAARVRLGSVPVPAPSRFRAARRTRCSHRYGASTLWTPGGAGIRPTRAGRGERVGPRPTAACTGAARIAGTSAAVRAERCSRPAPAGLRALAATLAGPAV
jgi:hypothetical protein